MSYIAGIVTPLCRKREIYSICREYNIIVVEDDAYYYLQYPDLQGTTDHLESGFKMGFVTTTCCQNQLEFICLVQHKGIHA